jgi:hypothetical protein
MKDKGQPIDEDSAVVNGRRYHLWPKFDRQKAQWIGGLLESYEDGACYSTTIKDIRFEPNGAESARLIIEGEKFEVGADVSCLAILASQCGEGWIAMSGFGGHWWRIKAVGEPTFSANQPTNTESK